MKQLVCHTAESAQKLKRESDLADALVTPVPRECVTGYINLCSIADGILSDAMAERSKAAASGAVPAMGRGSNPLGITFSFFTGFFGSALPYAFAGVRSITARL